MFLYLYTNANVIKSLYNLMILHFFFYIYIFFQFKKYRLYVLYIRDSLAITVRTIDKSFKVFVETH